MTWPDDEVKAGHGRLKASDADRDLVIDRLKTAYVQGRLTATSLICESGEQMSSRTYAELAMLTADIAGIGQLLPIRSVRADRICRAGQPCKKPCLSRLHF